MTRSFAGAGTALYAAAGGTKRLEILEGKGHTEWMFDDDPTFQHVIEVIDGFLAESFPASVAT